MQVRKHLHLSLEHKIIKCDYYMTFLQVSALTGKYHEAVLLMGKREEKREKERREKIKEYIKEVA